MLDKANDISFLKIWASYGWAKIFVITSAIIGIFDSVLSYILVSESNLGIEINPIVRIAFENNLGYIWLILNVILMVFFAIFVTGYRIKMEEFDFFVIFAFSFAYSIRTCLVVYSFALLYYPFYYGTFMFWSFVFSLIIFYNILKKGNDLTYANFQNWINYHKERIEFSLLIRGINKQKLASKDEIPKYEPAKYEKQKKTINKLFIAKYVSIIAITLIMIPLLIQIIVPILWPSFYRDPSRIFGAFTSLSASAFLASLIIMIIGLSIIMYSIIQLFDNLYVRKE